MKITTVGLDLGKPVSQVHGVDASGTVHRRIPVILSITLHRLVARAECRALSVGVRGERRAVQCGGGTPDHHERSEVHAALSAGWCGDRFPLLQSYLPSFPGFFLYFPQRRNLAPKLRALIDYVKRNARSDGDDLRS